MEPLNMPTPRHYAWVLAGRHVPPPAGAAAAPRAEFEAFVEEFGAELISLTALEGCVQRLPSWLRRIGWPRAALAQFVQSRAARFDAIIASGEDIGIPLVLASLLRRRKVPVHMLFHGHHLESRKLRLLAPVLRHMRHAHFHCLSEALRQRTIAVLGIDPARCHATGHAVDTSYFSGTVTSAAKVISSAGAANRDYATLAEAVRNISITVKIAADSTWVPPPTAMPMAGWPAHVELRSYGNYARLRELYSQSLFVVVPMHEAAHACGYAVIAEAMAMGRAVIATRTSAPPDYLQPDITGLFTEVHDADCLNGRIRDLLDHPDKAEALGRQARELIVARNSLERFCNRLEAIIAGALEPPRSSADI
jgi:glycosyltransferase involved in cell wall biosynthesis